MACCLFAAFLMAQCVAAVRRWGMFWGIVKIPQGERVETLASTMRSYLSIRWVRAFVFGVLIVEAVSVVGWVYVKHGEHIAEFADISWSRLHGRQVIYSELCSKDGQIKTRLVFDMNAGRT